MHTPPFRSTTLLLSLALAAALPASAAVPSPFTPMLDSTVEHHHLPGIAMAVVDNGQVVFTGTRGERRAGSGEPIDADTLFKIASNSKAMTAAVLARLVDRGLLAWDDPVTKYLPQFRMHDPWVTQHMQVRDLLIHNSGLGLGAGDLMLWPEPNAFTRADIIAGLEHLKPVTSFRSGYAYDNLMYVVAGEVAAAAGGKPYDQLLREEVFIPLGMTRCQAGTWSVAKVDNVAQPHARRGSGNVVVNADTDIAPDLTSMAAGGIRCSLRDMTRWMQVLLDPTRVPGWLSEPQRRALWTAHMPMPLGERQRRWDNAHFSAYGYGWRLSDMDGQWKVAHTGTLSGMYSSLALLPDRKVGVVILINGEGEDARTVLMQAALKHYTAPAQKQTVASYAAQLQAETANRHAAGHVRPDTSARKPVEPRHAWLGSADHPAATQGVALRGGDHPAAVQGLYRDPWLGQARLCPENNTLRFSVDKSPTLRGTVMQLDSRWLVQWDTLGADAEPWLQVEPGTPPTLRLSAIDPDIDFSYDYQDLHFTRIGDCP
ncbi:serine hydrolase domain-containing protein [Stenotrophomonas rhizophila]|uniref:serine hydrolase domain-containing protein n=1 Tax=Stenotrophomonas rhizophila TaxID=216778 RepID=UPI00081CD9AB|nr:serine hydrolase domain-containing protein [Stenotrophomonas rhizophila]AOA70990.1 penicillin-binding protein [Stenotrophomonas rhizophila]